MLPTPLVKQSVLQDTLAGRSVPDYEGMLKRDNIALIECFVNTILLDTDVIRSFFYPVKWMGLGV